MDWSLARSPERSPTRLLLLLFPFRFIIIVVVVVFLALFLFLVGRAGAGFRFIAFPPSLVVLTPSQKDLLRLRTEMKARSLARTTERSPKQTSHHIYKPLQFVLQLFLELVQALSVFRLVSHCFSD